MLVLILKMNSTPEKYFSLLHSTTAWNVGERRDRRFEKTNNGLGMRSKPKLVH